MFLAYLCINIVMSAMMLYKYIYVFYNIYVLYFSLFSFVSLLMLSKLELLQATFSPLLNGKKPTMDALNRKNNNTLYLKK